MARVEYGLVPVHEYHVERTKMMNINLAKKHYVYTLVRCVQLCTV